MMLERPYLLNKIVIKAMKYLSLILLLFVLACGSRNPKSIPPPKFRYYKRDTLHRDPSKIPQYKPFSKFKGDTLKYNLNNIYKRRDFYIGKPLDSLLKDLEMPVVYFSFTSFTNGRYKNQTTSINMYQDPPRVRENKMEQGIPSPTINVYWATPLKTDEVIALSRRGKGMWTEEARAYFGKSIIGDIDVMRKDDLKK